MTSQSLKKKLKAVDEQMSAISRDGDLNRARSVLVGNAFGGTVEISLRKMDGSVTWALLQPVEAIELIHQLSAGVGCHIHLQPRSDFSSWRNWQTTEEEKKHLNGHPPFANQLPLSKQHPLPPPENQPGLTINRSIDHAVATKKTVNKRSTKRASKTP
jgi:hypothetical protein